MSPLLAVVLCSLAQQMDAGQFTRAISGLMSPTKDEAFVFEGSWEYVGPREAIKHDPEEMSGTFQGSYAGRSDGALFVDLYSRARPGGAPLVRDTAAILGDRTDRLRQVPDQKAGTPQRLTKAAPRALLTAGSPLRLVYTWQFRNADAGTFPNFKQHGNESIDGHPCLHVECDTFPGWNRGEPKPRTHYWIDLQRGGHPLRVEYREGGSVVSRASIELAEVEDDGGVRLQYPRRCVFESFKDNNRQYDRPISRETIAIVPASLRLNQGLPDSVFSLNSKGGVTDTSGLAGMRVEFANPPPRPRQRTDYKSVQERLDKDMAKADEQAKRLEASGSVEANDWYSWLPPLLGVGGAAIVSIAGFLAWRRR